MTDPATVDPMTVGLDVGDTDRLLRAKINRETATAPWRELQRFFALGVAVFVDGSLDLVEVALSMSRDRGDCFREWMGEDKVGLVSDGQARRWLETDASLWTVVVKPWVLVQEMSGDLDPPNARGEQD